MYITALCIFHAWNAVWNARDLTVKPSTICWLGYNYFVLLQFSFCTFRLLISHSSLSVCLSVSVRFSLSLSLSLSLPPPPSLSASEQLLPSSPCYHQTLTSSTVPRQPLPVPSMASPNHLWNGVWTVEL